MSTDVTARRLDAQANAQEEEHGGVSRTTAPPKRAVAPKSIWHRVRLSVSPLRAVLSLPFGSAPLGSDEGLAFLQQRLAFFWKSFFFMGAFAFGATFLIRLHELRHVTQSNIVDSEFVWHVLSTLAPLGIWALARKVSASARRLFLLDGVGMTGVLSAYATMAMHGVPLAPERACFLMMLITMCTVVWRAICVPSTPSHTLAVTVFASLPVLVLTYFAALKYPTPGGLSAALATAYMSIWVDLSIAICAIASQVIYGLYDQVVEARRLGQYVLDELIGEGGMGAVYRARHALLRRPTAIKLVLPERVNPQVLKRFEREVQLTAMLTHPNTVSIYDYGHTADGTLYYAMEYLDGIDLENLVDRFGPQPAPRVIHILEQIAGSLSEAHAIGLVHRDIKPANVILCHRGGQSDVAKVVDFGLVKDVTAVAGGDPTLTNTNSIIGTPLYLAPEAILTPDAVDARSDLYAVGAVGYFLLTGQPVFTGGSIVEVCVQHVNVEPMPPSDRLGSEVPSELETLILRCLAKKPDARPQSAEELLLDLGSLTVSKWTREQSQDWWRLQGPELTRHQQSRRQPRDETKSPDTLLVDVVARG